MSRLCASEALDEKVWLFSGPHLAARERLWTHPRVSEIFPEVLFRMHCQARATVDLMRLACDQLASSPRDPLARPLLHYLEAHIPEETGHDEWLLESLEAGGIDRSTVLARLPPATIAAMVGSQYYWILHYHPVALLGYIKVVEREPSTTAEIGEVAKRLSLPRGMFKFHLKHARLEPRHNRDLDRLLDALPLQDDHQALIGISAQRSLHFAATGLEDLLRAFDLEVAIGQPESRRRSTVTPKRNPRSRGRNIEKWH
jgi:hypothetical protein